MGLFAEALGIYEEIFVLFPDLDGKIKDEINEQIHLLKKEIDELEQADSTRVSVDDISLLKSLSSQEDVTAIFDSSSAFKELGLFGEAVAEYEKLFFLDYPLDKIVPEMYESLCKVFSPDKIMEKIANIISDGRLDNAKKTGINYSFGLEMENRDQRENALELYKTAAKIDPKNIEIGNRIEAISSTLSFNSRYDYLLRKKIVTTDQLQKAFALSKKINKSVEFVLIDQYKISKADIGKSFSAFYGCQFRVYDQNIPASVELLGNLKKTFLLNELWIPLSWNKEGLDVLVDDPKNLYKSDNIKALMKTRKINFSVGIKEDIEEYIKRFFDSGQGTSESYQEGSDYSELDIIPDISFEEEEERDVSGEEPDEQSSHVVKLVDQVLISAYRKNASDIHIEPSPVTKMTGIRFRMDGVCQEYLRAPNSMAKGIVSRLKIMAELDIAERRLPQDGKIKFRRKGIPPFELRVATLPTAGGFEDVVLRILAKAGAMELDKMGLNERNLAVMKRIVAKPYGLVLVVGPTGSGKTTSLHSALGYINKPGVKIWTAEDPVEITQQGLRQVEARPKIGLDFARIMRAFLRADPDIIMIGEMRDHETASIGIEASLTGHLVFSTLHTNSAPETVTRLLDMGLNPLNFSDAFLGVMAQRLVRRLCVNCKEEYHPSQEEFDEIAMDYGMQYFEATGIKYSSDLVLYKTGNCDTCDGTGYKGRLGIHELMEGTHEIKRMIKKAATSESLFAQAMKEEMTTLKQDGILKAFKGLTDISEVRRVCIN
ncbi:MAG: Flp pilus assembly complex ATPase component TadA [Proteobacteria bacterium]|nr:Flp pilus assembly complex ATPase component TadA [Pseudomonadota bacterium]